MSIPTIEPTEFTAGDTVKWTKTLPDYPASEDWVLSYAFRGQSVIDITAGASGDDHAVVIPAATSSDFDAGDYWWQSYISKDDERYQIGSGSLKINRDLSTINSNFDNRSTVKKTLDALDAMLLGKASMDQSAYTIRDRSLQRMSPSELLKWKREYQRLYAAEQAVERKAQGLASKRFIKIRMNNE